MVVTGTIPPAYAGLIRREGISVIHDPPDCKVDLVILHGLNGSPYRTFSDSTTNFFWPEHISRYLPMARIMLFGYIADLSTGSSDIQGAAQHADSLLLHLKNNRVGPEQQKRPLVFLGHSLGGIIIKKALVMSSHRLSTDQTLQATRLIVFLGTPHRGSHLLDKPVSNLFLSAMKMGNKEVPKNIKSALQPRRPDVFAANTDFMQVKGKIAIVNFYEQVPTRMSELVVDNDSAVFDSEHSENIPLARDHHHLVRFSSPDDDAYHTVSQTLKRKVTQLLHEVAQSAHNGYSQKMMRACIQSLGDSQLPSSYGNAKEVHEKTLGWLRKPDNKLSRFMETGSGLFSVTGKPGSGKTFLMNELANQVRRRYRSQFAAVVQYAFTARGTPQEQSFDTFLRLAIKKLLRQCPLAFDAVMDEWLCVASDAGFSEAELCDSDEVGLIHWPISSLKKALHSIVTHISQSSRLCFIIDALDECDDLNGGTGDFVNFLRTISSAGSQSTGGGAVCVCFSCRDLPSTVDRVVKGGFRMEDYNEADISAYIEDRWIELTSLVGASDEMKQLKKDLIQRADGIFLWAHLALERIQTALDDGSTPAELREIIDDIPDQLGGLYALLLNNINPTYSKEAHMMLAVVLCAQRPMTVREFRYAMALTSSASIKFHKDLEVSRNMVKDDTVMKRRIQSRCGGLLEVKTVKDAKSGDDVGDNGPQIVQFMHQSVRDYLTGSSNSLKNDSDGLDKLMPTGQSTLSHACIQYLGFHELQDLARHAREDDTLDKESTMQRFAFFSYAGNFCFRHFQEAEKIGVEQTSLMDEHMGIDDGAFQNYVTIYNATHEGEKFAPGMTLLRLAVESNLASFVDVLLSRDDSDVNVPLDNGQSYLQLAVWKGNEKTLDVLLKHGADPNLPLTSSTLVFSADKKESETWMFQPPLAMACRKGELSLVQKLLDAGAQASECNTTHNGMHLNQALVSAAYSGKIEVVSLLLDSDPHTFAHPEIRFGAIYGLTHAYGEVLSDEFRYHRHGHTKSERLDASLQAAKKISHLIFSDVDVYELDFERSASTFWYLTDCRYEVLQRFLELDSDVSGAGGDGLSFFHAACLRGNVPSVQLLLRNRADPHASYSPRASSCLHLAVANETPAVLEYLLKKVGLQTDSIDCFGNTPLHDAAATRPDEFIDSLLRHGADRTIKNTRGQLPFHFAIANRKLKDEIGILKKLMVDNTTLEQPDLDGVPPLHAAARCGALPIVQWLMEEFVDISPVDDYGRTVLHMAAGSPSTDSTDILAFLLDGGASGLDVNARDSADMTALHHVFYEYETAQRHKHDRFSSLDPAVAAANARFLVQSGADLTARDNGGNTPLHLAAWRGIMEAVRLFLRQGADPKARDLNGLRALDVAEMEGVRELLEQAMEDAPPEYRSAIEMR